MHTKETHIYTKETHIHTKETHVYETQRVEVHTHTLHETYVYIFIFINSEFTRASSNSESKGPRKDLIRMLRHMDEDISMSLVQYICIFTHIYIQMYT